jgi:WD40 repeat protein
VAFSPDGKRIVSGSYDKTARVWDAETGTEKLALKGHTNAVFSVAFSPDGKRIVSGSNDQTARVWDAQTGTEKLALKGHTGWVLSVAFSPDGKRIVTGSSDQTARLWDTETVPEKVLFTVHTQEVGSVCFSPDGQRVFAWDADGNVRAWSTSDGTPTEPRDPPGMPPPGPARSADGSFEAEPRGFRIALYDLRPARAERQRYHGEQAALAEKEQNWFAVAFHVGRLLLDDPDNAELKNRREEALRKHAAR